MKNILAYLRANKEIAVKCVFAALCLAAAALIVSAGCREAKRPPPVPEVQEYEISQGTNFFAKTSATIEVEADIFLAERPEPLRTRLRVKPGSWIVPEQMLDVGGPLAKGAVCPAPASGERP